MYVIVLFYFICGSNYCISAMWHKRMNPSSQQEVKNKAMCCSGVCSEELKIGDRTLN